MINHERVEGTAPWAAVDGGEPHLVMPTTHLPWDVVKVPFVLSIECTTNAEKERRGGFYVSLRLGDRDNPVLTDDERAYIEGIVSGLLSELGKRIKAEYVNDGEEGGS